MGKTDIGPKIGIDGESEFRKQLNQINTSLKTLQTEMKKVSSEFNENAQSEQALIEKNKVLEKSIAAEKTKIEEVSYALEEARKKFGDNSTQAQQWEQILNRSQASLNNLETELRQNDQALSEMQQGLRDTATGLEKVDTSAKGLNRLGETMKGAVLSGAKALTAAVIGIGVALGGLSETTREYQQDQGKLTAAFTTAGFSTKAAQNTYSKLYSVLGESDQAVEAANHLAKLTDNTKDLQTWTNICTGVYATFGDSLPIEGLTEAANETAKVGTVTGPLADALNWAGISEEEFNKKLAACTSEQERQDLIMRTLNDTYKDAAGVYKETNGDVMAANDANRKLADSLARIGSIVRPIVTEIKLFAASALNGIASVLEKIRSLPSGIQIAIGAFAALVAGIGPGILAFNKIIEIQEQFKKGLSELGTLFGKNTTKTTANATAITADSAAMTANATATNLATKAKQLLNKALTVGKWVAIGAAIAGAAVLIYKFATDAEGATAMLQSFGDKASQMIQTFASMIPQIVSGITAAIPQIIEVGVQIFQALVQGITIAIPAIVNAIPQIITALTNGIISNMPMLIQAALQLINGLVMGITQALPLLIEAIPQIITAIVTAISNNLPSIINSALNIIVTLGKGLIQALPQLIAVVPQIIAAIVSALGSLAGQLINAGISAIQSIWKGFSSWVETLGTNVKRSLSSLPNKVKSAIGSLRSIGADWVKGLWNGINDKVEWIYGKIKSFGNAVLDKIKSVFKINSPSIVMEKEVGVYLAEGIGVGFIKQMRLVNDMINASLIKTYSTAEKIASAAIYSAPQQMIDYNRLAEIMGQGIYLDGRLVGRTMKGRGLILV